MTTSSALPALLKTALIFLSVIAFFFTLWVGQDILVPLIFATILAIVLDRLVNFLQRRGMGRVLAIVLAMLAAMGIMAAVVYFLSSQIAHFSDALPSLKVKLKGFMDQSVGWAADYFNVKEPVVRSWLASAKAKGMENGSKLLGTTLTALGAMFAFVFLLPVYIFLILFYKPLILAFIAKLFPAQRHAAVNDVLVQTRSLVQSYLIGLLLEALIVAVLDSAGLLCIGIDSAVLLGVIAALLNVIPYIGGIVAISLPMLMAIATKGPTAALLVLLVYMAVQFIDNHYIVPKVVASRVKLNALVSIVVVLIGGLLWGVAGMFLAIPLTAILKVVCDRIPALEAFGYLLGDDQPHPASSLLKIPSSQASKRLGKRKGQ